MTAANRGSQRQVANVYTGAADGSINEYELRTGSLLRVLCKLPHPVASILTTGIPVIVTVDAVREMRVFSVEKAECVGTLKIPMPSDAPSGAEEGAGLSGRGSDAQGEGSRAASPTQKLGMGAKWDQWGCEACGEERCDEVVSFVRKLATGPLRRELGEGEEVPSMPFVAAEEPKADGGGGGEAAQQIQANAEAEDGKAGKPAVGDGQSVVFAYRLITLLSKAFPHMVGAPGPVRCAEGACHRPLPLSPGS